VFAQIKGGKMKLIKPAVLVLFLLTAEVQATPLIIRTGAVNKPFQVLAWATLTYYQNNQSYDWTNNRFNKVDPSLDVLSADILASVGLPFKIELGGVVPIIDKKQGERHSSGIGDVLVVARYGFLQFPLLPVKGALSLGASLPTGDKDAALALGDGSTDFAAALAFNTTKILFLVGHLRGAYWLNGKTNDSTKLGNMFEYMAGLDFPVTAQLTPQLALTGYWQDRKKIHGTPIVNTELSRTNLTFLLMYKPLPLLTVRPKFSLPLKSMSSGGSIADYYLGLDIWATLP